MTRVAVTGGIGSGKTFVCRLLERRGISVYDSDAAAKRLMRDDADLRQRLQALVGDEVYINKVLQKAVLAQYLLASEAHKQAVNDIVHPAVAADFMQSGYQWLESAILFDSGFYKRVPFDYYVCVTAPLELRVQRVMQRDGITRAKTMEWIGRQMPQEEVARRCHYVIENDGQKDLDKQIIQLLNNITNH